MVTIISISKGTKIKRKVGGKIKNLQGQKFGYLTVLEYTHVNEHASVVWKCICKCGNTITAKSSSLKKGYKNSCGCFKNDLEIGKSSFNSVFRRYKKQAKNRKIDSY